MKYKELLINQIHLMKEWDFDKNQNLDPSKLPIGSNKLAFWICSLCGNKWKTSVYNRAVKGSCCRNCSSRRRLDFDVKKSIFTTHPGITKDWSKKENAKLTPKMFPKGSRYIVNWECHACGFKTKKSIRSYNGCIQCKKNKKLQKKSLETEYPKIAKEWDINKNGQQLPEHFKPGSTHKAWWLCPICNNSYKAEIGKRTANKGATACPKCGVEKSTQAKRKAVEMIDPNTKEILKAFISISVAAREMKINGSNISMVCKGV